MLTINQIVSRTPSAIRTNAADVVLKNIKRGVLKSGQRAVKCKAYSHYTAAGTRKSSPPEVYECMVIGLGDPKKPVGSRYVKITCKCDWFWSHCEVALNRRGAADIIHSNGEMPVQTNPKLIPVACKHLIALMLEIQERGL